MSEQVDHETLSIINDGAFTHSRHTANNMFWRSCLLRLVHNGPVRCQRHIDWLEGEGGENGQRNVQDDDILCRTRLIRSAKCVKEWKFFTHNQHTFLILFLFINIYIYIFFFLRN